MSRALPMRTVYAAGKGRPLVEYGPKVAAHEPVVQPTVPKLCYTAGARTQGHPMSQAQHRPMTADEFLAWEARQDGKWEFDGFQPVAMIGGTVAHSAIGGNLITALNNRLRGKPCRPFGPDLKVQIGSKYRYPDAFVSCTPIPLGATVAAEPVVIFEVLSDSTSREDRTTKLVEYRSLPSVQRYVMLEQDQALVTVITRVATGWSLELLDGSGTLDMPEIGVELPVAELYDGLDLTPESASS